MATENDCLIFSVFPGWCIMHLKLQKLTVYLGSWLFGESLPCIISESYVNYTVGFASVSSSYIMRLKLLKLTGLLSQVFNYPVNFLGLRI